MSRRALTNEQGIQRISKLVDDIYKTLGEPLPHGEMMRGGIDNYTDPDGIVYFTKMLRNATASQRLYSVVDRYKDLVFGYRYMSGKLKIESNKVSKSFLKTHIGRNLVVTDSEIIKGLINFLSYYYDLESKDDDLEISTFRNLLYIKDPTICIRFESHLLNHQSFAIIERILRTTLNDYEGLPVLTQENRNTFQLHALRPYPINEVLEATNDLATNVYDFLAFFLSHISKTYTDTIGPDSPNDFNVKVDHTGAYVRLESTLEPITPIKIYNLTRDTFNISREGMFVLHKNRSFKEIEEQFYRNGTQTRTNINMTQQKPLKIERTEHGPQEGANFWTHTLVPLTPSLISTHSKLLVQGNYVEDLTLTLTFLSGVGVYTDRSSLTYSHKAQAFTYLQMDEIDLALNEALNGYEKAAEKDAQFLGLLLTKYRETLQPMSINLELIRYWEIIDTIADYFSIKNNSRMKPVPERYLGKEKTLVKEVSDALKEIEDKNGWNLTNQNGLTPILLEKSVSQKIIDAINFLELEEWLGLGDGELQQRIKQAYGIRSKNSHSSNIFESGKKQDDLMSYFLFSSQLTFVIIMKVLNVSSNQTIRFIGKDIKGFIDDKNYYTEKNMNSNAKSKEFEQFLKYFSGEENWPDNYPRSFTI